LGPSRIAPDTPDRAEEAVNTFLKTQPDSTNTYELHQWVIVLVGYIMSWIRLLFAALGTRMQTLKHSLEKRVDETDAVVSVLNNQVKAHAASIATAIQDVQALAATTVRPNPSSSSGSSSGKSSTRSSSSSTSSTTSTTHPGSESTCTRATQGSSGCLLRCSKCHARGHDAENCRTQNPSAVRRRIAQNNKIRKDHLRQGGVIPLTQYNLSQVPSVPTFTQPSYVSPSLVQTSQSTIADTAELQRRIAQLNRDRRRHRATTTNPSSSSK
jgi:hypothetical protein